MSTKDQTLEQRTPDLIAEDPSIRAEDPSIKAEGPCIGAEVPPVLKQEDPQYWSRRTPQRQEIRTFRDKGFIKSGRGMRESDLGAK